MSGNGNDKRAYVCGPLTELPDEIKIYAKRFYESIADVCELVTGKRAFVPHEHYDPEKHAKYTPADVDRAERKQVCEKTSVLIVAPIAPSWGGGIEVEMANRSGVPVIILCGKQKFFLKKISRLLLGNPAAQTLILYETESEALNVLRDRLRAMFRQDVAITA